MSSFTDGSSAPAQASESASDQRHWLAGRVAVVTGASRGIGAATAEAVAAAGAHVVLAARDRQALDAVAAEHASAEGQAPSFNPVRDHAVAEDIHHGCVRLANAGRRIASPWE